jgi:hypothetical protein
VAALSLRHWDIGQHGVWGGLVPAERGALRADGLRSPCATPLGTILTNGQGFILTAAHLRRTPAVPLRGRRQPGSSSGQGLDVFGARWDVLASPDNEVTNG